MSTKTEIKPEEGDKVHRMADGPLRDDKGNALKNTTGNVVDFEVEYPKDTKEKGVIKGAPYFGLKNGEVHKLHVVHAQVLVDKGLGKIKK